MLLLQLCRHPEYTAWICHALVIYSSQACWDGVITQAKQVLHHTQARGEVPWQRIWKKSHFPIRITWALTVPVPLHYDSSDNEESRGATLACSQSPSSMKQSRAFRGQHKDPHCIKHGLWLKALPSETSGFRQKLVPPLSNTIPAELLSGQWWQKGCEMIPGFIQVTGFSHELVFPVMPHPVFLGTKFSSQADCLMRKGNPSITKNQLSRFHSHLMSSHRCDAQRNFIWSRPFPRETLKI